MHPFDSGNIQCAVRYALAEGFRVGLAECRECKARWIAILDPNCIAWRLECPHCGKQHNYFTPVTHVA